MADYVPGSLAEIAITQRAAGEPFDGELRELAELAIDELDAHAAGASDETRYYLARGAHLLRAMLDEPEP